MGSAALAFAYVADGRFDAYVESGVRLWDVAAGSLAGGMRRRRSRLHPAAGRRPCGRSKLSQRPAGKRTSPNSDEKSAGLWRRREELSRGRPLTFHVVRTSSFRMNTFPMKSQSGLVPGAAGILLLPAVRARPTGFTRTSPRAWGNFSCSLNYTNAPKTVARLRIGLATGEQPWLEPEHRPRAFHSLLRRNHFHRVISGFVIQAGSPNGMGTDGPGYSFQDEISPTLKHDSAACFRWRIPEGTQTAPSSLSPRHPRRFWMAATPSSATWSVGWTWCPRSTAWRDGCERQAQDQRGHPIPRHPAGRCGGGRL
jgi:cyclophilin family peptidyl-prolyl cis-trans isomerase